MATLYLNMKQRIVLSWNDSVFFEKFHGRCVEDFYAIGRSITLSNVMSFISQINNNKEMLISFCGIEAGAPHYVYSVHQKTSISTYKETGVYIVFKENVFNSKMFFSSSRNNICLNILHKYTQFVDLNFPEETKKFKKSIKKLIDYITWSLHGSLEAEFKSSTIVVDVVTDKKVSQDTFVITSKIFFTQSDFVVFHLYLNITDKTKNKLVITKFTEDT